MELSQTDYRTAFDALGGKGTNEIAKKHGITAGAVTNRLNRLCDAVPSLTSALAVSRQLQRWRRGK